MANELLTPLSSDLGALKGAPTLGVPSLEELLFRATLGKTTPPQARPDLADLYKQLADVSGKEPDYHEVEKVAASRADKANADLMSGLAMQMFGGKTMSNAGRAVLSNAVEQGNPLRANAADVGYYDPDSGKFVENPAMRQGRKEKALLAQIAGGEKALSAEQERLLRQTLANQRNTTQIVLKEMGNKSSGASAGPFAGPSTKLGIDSNGVTVYRNTKSGIPFTYDSEGNPVRFQGKIGQAPTAAQVKSGNETAEELANLSGLTSSFKPEYAGGPEKQLEVAVGNIMGGWAPKTTEEATRWWADYKMFNELPQRHALFGATLTEGEKAAWNAASINPRLSPEVIKERLAKQRAIREAGMARLSGKPAPAAPQTPLTVVRTGTRNGVKVQQMSDGSIREVR